MQAVETPLRPARRLRFSTLGTENPLLASLPSPYTPFSGQRSGTTPSGTPQVAPSRPSATPPLAPSFAEDYAATGLDIALRSASLDIISALHPRRDSVDVAKDLISESIAAIEDQLSTCTELLDAPALHAHTRRRVRARHTALLAEHATWLLIDTVWRPSEMRSRDLTTRRLAPDLFSDVSVLDVPGYPKVQRIVEWLERSADESLERAGGPMVKPLNDPAYRWQYSAELNGGAALSMDFPQQNPSQLDEVERKAELRLSREIFRLVRAGRLEEAEEICREVGQPWRAAALAGGKRSSALSANGIIGHARKSWRMAAAAVARSQSPGITPHERAVYGVFSGVLEPVLAVASTYEDEAWARLTVMLDSTAERVLDGCDPESAKIEDAIIMQAFRECRHATEGSEAIGDESLHGIRMTRAYLGLGPGMSSQHLSELLGILAELAQAGARQRQEWICRFSAHICLYLKLSGLLSDILSQNEDCRNFDSCLESYVQLIVEMDREEEDAARMQGTILPARALICDTAATYLAEMTSNERIVRTYSQLLDSALRGDLAHERAEAQRIGVAPREIDDRRTLCLEKAGQCFQRDALDKLVLASLDLVWGVVLPASDAREITDSDLDSHTAVLDKVTDDDELVIRAIEFLIFPAFPNYEEALHRATIAARRFFLHGKRSAARQLIEWFPAEVISQVPASSRLGAINELNSWRVYMDAVARHSDWNMFHCTNLPVPIPVKTKAEALAPPGEVSYEVQANANIQLQKYQRDREEFLRQSAKHREAAVESLRAALLFEGGWMHDGSITEGIPAGEEEEAVTLRHADELRAVRRLAIPQLAMLLHHVLHESGMYQEAISLAQTVADENLKLYANFGPIELGSFLKRIADSTVLFADESIRVDSCQRPYLETLFEEISNEQ